MPVAFAAAKSSKIESMLLSEVECDGVVESTRALVTEVDGLKLWKA